MYNPTECFKIFMGTHGGPFISVLQAVPTTGQCVRVEWLTDSIKKQRKVNTDKYIVK